MSQTYYKPFSDEYWDWVMEVLLYVQYGSCIIWIFNLPIFLVIWMLFELYKSVGFFVTFAMLFKDYPPGSPQDEGINFGNWVFFVLRKYCFYDILLVLGMGPQYIPFIGWLMTVIFGGAQWINWVLF